MGDEVWRANGVAEVKKLVTAQLMSISWESLYYLIPISILLYCWYMVLKYATLHVLGPLTRWVIWVQLQILAMFYLYFSTSLSYTVTCMILQSN